MLVLVVGPSGAGKDTLLDAARRMLEGDTRFRFVRRTITRPFDGGVEAHEPADEAGFEARRNAGAFGLFWRAHGFAYGIPSDIGIDLEQGRVVVANVSRAVIADAAQRYRAKVIEITAPAEVLARRLAARGREDAVSAASRLARSVPVPASVEKETIMNDGTVEQGAKRLAGALIRVAEAVLQS